MPAILLAGLAGCVFLFLFNPSDIRGFPQCPFYALTGLKCPGCGTLRGVHHLLHGRFAAAWQMNPLLLVSIPFVGASVFWPRWRNSAYVSRAALAVTVAYWIGRNLVG